MRIRISNQWGSLILVVLMSQAIHAQNFTLPKITYDKVKITRSDANGNIGQKKYYKGNQVVLEVNYPFKGSIKGYCYSSNIVYDSTYIYPANQRVYITFRSRKVFYSTWKKGGNLLHETAYWPNGKLRYKITRVATLDLLNPSAECGNDKFEVGESFRYDKNGKLTSYENFSTGKLLDPKKQKVLANPRFKKMRKVADKTLQKAFGKRFFREYIAVNYGATKFQLSSKEKSDYRNRLPRRGDGADWFYYPVRKKPYDCIDFAYLMKLDDHHWFNTIVVRVDTLGKVVFKKMAKYRGYENATQGFLEKRVAKLLTTAQALKRLRSAKMKYPLTKEYWVRFVWKASEAGSAKGSYYYQFLYDQLHRSDYGSSQVYYRQALVNATNGKITLSKDEVDGEESMEMPPRRQKRNKKYGIVDYREIMIPFDYEQLPEYLSSCMIARRKGKYGVIDHENRALIPLEFDQVYYLKTTKKRYREFFLVVVKNGLLGLYDRTGEELLEPQFAKITVDDDQEKIILETSKGKKQVYRMGKN